MSESCDHNCGSCKSGCENPDNMLIKAHELSEIKKVIGVVSGKGGVGKSLVTGLLASAVSKRGLKVGVLDADITGPSIPKMFGISGVCEGDDIGVYPSVSKGGIRVMSSNLLLGKDTDPVIWRGPLIANMVKQFWSEVIWGKTDIMFIDMPPGTGDVPLTVFQSIKVDGIIIVTSPQELVSMIVEKAVRMAEMMNIPILGVVENMSYFKCPCCGEEVAVYGGGKIDEVATDFHLKVLGRIPIMPEIAARCDKGDIESVEAYFLENAVNAVINV